MASDVATTICMILSPPISSAEKAKNSAGTKTIPPPTPRSPDRKPPPAPISAMIKASSKGCAAIFFLQLRQAFRAAGRETSLDPGILDLPEQSAYGRTRRRTEIEQILPGQRKTRCAEGNRRLI